MSLKLFELVGADATRPFSRQLPPIVYNSPSKLSRIDDYQSDNKYSRKYEKYKKNHLIAYTKKT